MGGFGSGRQYGKPIAEEALRIDFCWMLRRGLAQPGRCIPGNLRWTRGGEPSGNIDYTCDMRDPDNASMELRFSVTRHRTGERKQYVQRVPLSYTVPQFGGRRWWMHCPVTGQRVAKLFVPAGGDIFASRKAWRIAYRSQRGSRSDRAFDRLNRLQRKLGCQEGWEMPIRRPKGMHHRTYARYEERYWELDEQCGQEMIVHLARLGPAFRAHFLGTD